METCSLSPPDDLTETLSVVTCSTHAGAAGVSSFGHRPRKKGKRRTYPAWYVYLDSTCETNPRVFYVGAGNARRINDLHRDNAKHTNIVKKHGQRREIVFASSLSKACFDHEIDLIAELHTFVGDPRHNGIGCNFTKGGDGTVGRCVSDETRAKLRLINVGKKDTLETRQKKSHAQRVRATFEALNGIKRVQGTRPSGYTTSLKGQHKTAEHRRKISESLKGKKRVPFTEERKLRARERTIGKRRTEEQRMRMRAAALKRWERQRNNATAT
jgi:hypothetical protein